MFGKIDHGGVQHLGMKLRPPHGTGLRRLIRQAELGYLRTLPPLHKQQAILHGGPRSNPCRLLDLYFDLRGHVRCDDAVMALYGGRCLLWYSFTRVGVQPAISRLEMNIGPCDPRVAAPAKSAEL